MRVLHTSDWHLGRSLGEHKLIEQQALFTDWLVEAVRQEGVDVVVVSGDLFDRSLPPTDAWELLCDSFGRLRAEGAIVAAIAGNHDSAARIAATAGITDLAGIHMRGGFGGTAVTHLQVGEEPLSLVLVPYLNPHMAPEELAGELRGDGHSVTHERLIAHDLDRARSRLREGTPSLVLAHAFVTGAAPSDSERELAVGDAGMVSASVFGGFDYVALGHLHRPQEIAGSPSVRYSGSPLPYSFSERAPKSVVLADFSAGGLRSVEQVPIDVGRGVARLGARRAHRRVAADRPRQATARQPSPPCRGPLGRSGEQAGVRPHREGRRASQSHGADLGVLARCPGRGALRCGAGCPRRLVGRAGTRSGGGCVRPRRLEATAFGPFAERIAMDFTRLPSDQPFLIGGPTGAGKTSLLDAVTYALYGELPGQRKKADGVRSHHAAEDVDCRVSLEFEVGSEVYRITRTPSRTVSGRKTPVPATARLERLTGDSFQPVETKLSEVREAVRSAIGLSAEQFQRVVLLPQGEFAKMLHAPTTERAPLLRSLFGTSMYRRLGEHLAQQRDQLRRRTERLAEQVRDKRTSAAELLQSAEQELAASGFGEPFVRAGQEVTESCDELGAPGTDAASRSPDAVVIHIAEPEAGAPGSGEDSWPDSGPTHGELALRLDQVRAGGLRDAVGSAAEATENADAASAAVVRAEEQGRQLQELEKLHRWRDELEATAGESREHTQALEADAAAQPLLPLIEGRDRLAVDLASQESALAAAADARDSALRSCRDHLAGAPVGNDPASASALAETARRAAADFDLLAERAARAVELDSEVTGWVESIERLGSEVAEVARASEIAEAARAGLLAEAKDHRATVERLEPLRSNAEGLRKLRDDLGKLHGLHEEHRWTTAGNDSLEADLEAARSQAERLAAELAPARELADTGDDLSEALGAAKELVEVSRERDRLVSLRHEASRKAEEQEALVERCFEAYVSATAPRLAEELVAGQPCMVCGSTDHPAPAEAGEGRVVDAADLERVRSDARRSASERERLTDQVKVLISSHPGLAGASTEELSSRVTEAEERCRRREEALAEVGRLEEALEEAQQAMESMAVRLADRRERLSELNGAIAQATDALGESAARDVEELAGELAAAEKSVLEAESAVGRLGEIDRHRAAPHPGRGAHRTQPARV
jgi:exonuclease SbcD